MNEKTQSISERMFARKGEAKGKCNTLIWANADADDIAAVALAGGVEPHTLDVLAVEVAKAKATIQAAIQANDQMPELDKANNAARIDLNKKVKALEAAQAAHDAASSVSWEAAEALRVAQSKLSDGVQLVFAVTIPDGHAPAFLVELAQRQKEEEAQAIKANLINQKRSLISAYEENIADHKKMLNSEKGNDPMKGNQIATGAGLMSLQDALTSRIRADGERMEAVKAEIAALLADEIPATDPE